MNRVEKRLYKLTCLTKWCVHPAEKAFVCNVLCLVNCCPLIAIRRLHRTRLILAKVIQGLHDRRIVTGKTSEMSVFTAQTYIFWMRVKYVIVYLHIFHCICCSRSHNTLSITTHVLLVHSGTWLPGGIGSSIGHVRREISNRVPIEDGES